jgi:hypothetical protein
MGAVVTDFNREVKTMQDEEYEALRLMIHAFVKATREGHISKAQCIQKIKRAVELHFEVDGDDNSDEE